MKILTTSDLDRLEQMPQMNRLVDYFMSFIFNADLWQKSQKIYIGVSGGRDSNFLWLLTEMAKRKQYIPEYEILHCNHGIRQQSDEEQRWVKKQAKKWQVTCHIKKLKKLSYEDSDMENKARILRHKFFLKYVSQKNVLFLAHHIDDSLEWSLFKKIHFLRFKVTAGTCS